VRFLNKIFFGILLLGTSVFGVQILEEIRIEKETLHLRFNQPFDPNQVKSFTLTNPQRQVIDIKNTKLKDSSTGAALRGSSRVRFSQFNSTTVRIVIEGEASQRGGPYVSTVSRNLFLVPIGKLVVSSGVSKGSLVTVPKSVPQKPAPKPANVASKGVVVVIDPGHGGKDPGAVSGGKKEKDIVFAVSKKLQARLQKQGFDVYLTRNDDRFVTLEQRTKLADKKDAKIFVSIHTNAAPNAKSAKTLSGVETFFLQNTRDKRSQAVAARENSSVLQKADHTSKNVILSSVLSGPKIMLSNKLAIDIQRNILGSLAPHYKTRDGGVRHAPFWVLVGASRPSVLVEIGYITNPTERNRLVNSHYQELIAKGIADGIVQYLANRQKEMDYL